MTIDRRTTENLPTENLRVTWLCLCLLFVAAWLPRVWALDAFVTPDERKWINRSANFSVALSRHDYAATFQKEHPGVSVTWIGAAALRARIPDYTGRVDGALTDTALEQWLHAEAGIEPLELLVTARQAMILVISLLLALCYLPLRHLLPRAPSLLAVLLVSWSPFMLGLSRLFHPDGLLAATVLLAFLLYVAWLRDAGSGMYLVASGLVTGIALLTKTPAVLLLPAAGLLSMMAARTQGGGASTRRKLTGWLLWCAIAALCFVLFWPAMWVDPLHVLNRIVLEMRHYQVDGHSLPSYFNGRNVADPGLLFYPVAALMRTSPVTLLGLLLALTAFVRGWGIARTTSARRLALGVLLFCSLYLFAVTTSAKKFDRYILPAISLLAVPAAIGWYAAGERFMRPGTTARNLATVALAVAALQGALALTYAPYYLTYFNPVAGGARTASTLLMVGWGEGLEQAARWINQEEGGADARVVAWYGDGPVSYYLESERSVLSFFDSENFWIEADYAIVYANQWQRQNPDPDMFSFLAQVQPSYTFGANGLELVRVYDLRALEPPAYSGLHRLSTPIDLGAATVVAYRIARPTLVAGEEIEIDVLLSPAESSLAQPFTGSLSVAGASGEVWSEQGATVTFDPERWDAGRVYADRYLFSAPDDLAPGDYQLQFQRLTDGGVEARVGVGTLGLLTVQAPVQRLPDARWPELTFTQISHAPSVAAGIPLLITLDAAGRIDGTLKVSLRLLDENGKSHAQQDKVITSSMHFELPIPDTATIGTYSLSAVVYSPETLAALSDSAGAAITTLSEVKIR